MSFVHLLLSSSQTMATWLVHRRGKATISGSLVGWNPPATIGFLTAVAEIGRNALNRGRPGSRKWRDRCITYTATTTFLPSLDRTLQVGWLNTCVIIYCQIVSKVTSRFTLCLRSVISICIHTVFSFPLAKIVSKPKFISCQEEINNNFIEGQVERIIIHIIHISLIIFTRKGLER